MQDDHSATRGMHAHARLRVRRSRRVAVGGMVLALSAGLGLVGTRITAEASLATCSATVSPPCIFGGFEILCDSGE